MAAVVQAVEQVVTAAVDVVGDVVQEVSHVVEQAGQTVEKTVQAVIDDPLPTLLAVAGNAIGIPAPVTMAAITAARGGDLEDIALSAGTAFLAPTATNSLASTFSSTLIEAGANEAMTQVISSAVSKGLVNGTIAELKGGDFNDGFSGAFTGSVISSGVGEVAEYVKPEVMEMAQENGFDLKTANQVLKDTSKAVSAGISAEVTGNNDFVTAFTNSAISSSVDAGTRSLNKTIDEQFSTAAKKWDEETPDTPPVATETVGAGIPPQLVSEVQVSDLGFDSQPMKESEDSPIANSYAGASFDFDERTGTYRSTGTDEPPESTESKLAAAPEAEKASDFEDQLLGPSFNVEEPKAENAAEFAEVFGPTFNRPDAENVLAGNEPAFNFEESPVETALADQSPLAQASAEQISPVEAALAEQEQSPLAQVSEQLPFVETSAPESSRATYLDDILASIQEEQSPFAGTSAPESSRAAYLDEILASIEADRSPFAEASAPQSSRAEYLDSILANVEAEQAPQNIVDVAETAPAVEEGLQPKGGLSELAQASIEAPSEAPVAQEAPVISEAPIARDLLNPDPSQQPIGGLNAAAQTPEEKLAKAQGLKATDFTRPAVASVGNILKSTLMQGRKPQQRVATRRPTGALQTAKAKPSAPPKMDVSKLIPIQKATTAQARPRAAQTLDSSAKLSPVKNIAGLTSLLNKKAG
jgi:hypothetical protein